MHGPNENQLLQSNYYVSDSLVNNMTDELIKIFSEYTKKANSPNKLCSIIVNYFGNSKIQDIDENETAFSNRDFE